MMKRIWIFAALSCVFSTFVHANVQQIDDAHVYDINLDEDIPNTYTLRKKYQKSVSDFDWKYYYTWSITPGFDSDFKEKITTFGAVEKRINSEQEDGLLREIKRIPKAYYPYIGPVLHTIPGLSGKILDLPGIKETKNQFPQRIASPFKNIPNLEFLSPDLYPFLMPQIWGEDMDALEFPTPVSMPPHIPTVRIKPQFLQDIRSRVPPEDFAVGKPRKNKQKDDKRNFMADKNTPLTQADVRAFISTLDDVFDFQSRNKSQIHVQLVALNGLMSWWDEQNGSPQELFILKGAVNPCQMAVRKIKWSHHSSDFQKIIGQKGFGLNDWAYTCDKTIKAYRTANVNNAFITAINLLNKGYYYRILEQYQDYTPEEMQIFKHYLAFIPHLYSTNREEVEAVRPYRKQIQEELLKFRALLLGAPLILL